MKLRSPSYASSSRTRLRRNLRRRSRSYEPGDGDDTIATSSDDGQTYDTYHDEGASTVAGTEATEATEDGESYYHYDDDDYDVDDYDDDDEDETTVADTYSYSKLPRQYRRNHHPRSYRNDRVVDNNDDEDYDGLTYEDYDDDTRDVFARRRREEKERRRIEFQDLRRRSGRGNIVYKKEEKGGRFDDDYDDNDRSMTVRSASPRRGVRLPLWQPPPRSNSSGSEHEERRGRKEAEERHHRFGRVPSPSSPTTSPLRPSSPLSASLKERPRPRATGHGGVAVKNYANRRYHVNVYTATDRQREVEESGPSRRGGREGRGRRPARDMRRWCIDQEEGYQHDEFRDDGRGRRGDRACRRPSYPSPSGRRVQCQKNDRRLRDESAMESGGLLPSWLQCILGDDGNSARRQEDDDGIYYDAGDTISYSLSGGDSHTVDTKFTVLTDRTERTFDYTECTERTAGTACTELTGITEDSRNTEATKGTSYAGDADEEESRRRDASGRNAGRARTGWSWFAFPGFDDDEEEEDDDDDCRGNDRDGEHEPKDDIRDRQERAGQENECSHSAFHKVISGDEAYGNGKDAVAARKLSEQLMRAREEHQNRRKAILEPSSEGAGEEEKSEVKRSAGNVELEVQLDAESEVDDVGGGGRSDRAATQKAGSNDGAAAAAEVMTAVATVPMEKKKRWHGSKWNIPLSKLIEVGENEKGTTKEAAKIPASAAFSSFRADEDGGQHCLDISSKNSLSGRSSMKSKDDGMDCQDATPPSSHKDPEGRGIQTGSTKGTGSEGLPCLQFFFSKTDGIEFPALEATENADGENSLVKSHSKAASTEPVGARSVLTAVPKGGEAAAAKVVMAAPDAEANAGGASDSGTNGAGVVSKPRADKRDSSWRIRLRRKKKGKDEKEKENDGGRKEKQEVATTAASVASALPSSVAAAGKEEPVASMVSWEEFASEHPTGSTTTQKDTMEASIHDGGVDRGYSNFWDTFRARGWAGKGGDTSEARDDDDDEEEGKKGGKNKKAAYCAGFFMNPKDIDSSPAGKGEESTSNPPCSSPSPRQSCLESLLDPKDRETEESWLPTKAMLISSSDSDGRTSGTWRLTMKKDRKVSILRRSKENGVSDQPLM